MGWSVFGPVSMSTSSLRPSLLCYCCGWCSLPLSVEPRVAIRSNKRVIQNCSINSISVGWNAFAIQMWKSHGELTPSQMDVNANVKQSEWAHGRDSWVECESNSQFFFVRRLSFFFVCSPAFCSLFLQFEEFFFVWTVNRKLHHGASVSGAVVALPLLSSSSLCRRRWPLPLCDCVYVRRQFRTNSLCICNVNRKHINPITLQPNGDEEKYKQKVAN